MKAFVVAATVAVALLCPVAPGAVGPGPAPVAARQEEDELAALRQEVARLGEQVAALEARIARLEGVDAGAGEPVPGTVPAALVGGWVETASTAEADCGGVFCAYRYDWPDLELRADGTYAWGEGPYGRGTFEVFARGTAGDLDVVLVGEGADNRCLATFDAFYGTLSIAVPRCPGLFAAPAGGGEPQELALGFISFEPAR